MNLRQSLLVAVLLSTAGAAAAWLVTREPEPIIGPTGQPSSSLAPMITELAESDSLSPELIASLLRLEERLVEQTAEVEALTEKVARLEAGLSSSDESLTSIQFNEGFTVGDVAANQRQKPRDAAGRSRRDRVVVEDLIDLGVDPLEAAEIVAAVDQIALDRMQLRFEAARDGGLNAAEYRQAMGELPDERTLVQSEFGDDAYDRYLYASGRSNRVVVTDVLQESIAQQIGLQRGDVLIALDDQRIYGSRDIMSIASRNSGSIPLTVRRGDQLVQYYVESGPLGVRTRRSSENPEADPP